MSAVHTGLYILLFIYTSVSASYDSNFHIYSILPSVVTTPVACGSLLSANHHEPALPQQRLLPKSPNNATPFPRPAIPYMVRSTLVQLPLKNKILFSCCTQSVCQSLHRLTYINYLTTIIFCRALPRKCRYHKVAGPRA